MNSSNALRWALGFSVLEVAVESSPAAVDRFTAAFASDALRPIEDPSSA